MMLFPILNFCILFVAAVVGYAVHRGQKLAELKQLHQSCQERLERQHERIDLDAETLAGLDALSQAIAASKVSLVPPDAHTVVQQIGKTEPVGWFDDAGNWYKVPELQPDYEEIQAVYPEWKPGE